MATTDEDEAMHVDMEELASPAATAAASSVRPHLAVPAMPKLKIRLPKPPPPSLLQMSFNEAGGGSGMDEDATKTSFSRDSSEFEADSSFLHSSTGGGSGGGKKSGARRRITEFIQDKQLRLRSYVRRRPIPFKRIAELDAACGTKSFLLQFCPDFDECLFSGPDELVSLFLSDSGIRFTDVEKAVAKREHPKTLCVVVLNHNVMSVLSVGHVPAESPHQHPKTTAPRTPSSKSRPTKSLFNVDDNDDDYAPTVFERKRNKQAKR